ncbi:DUF7331 family protein [Haloarchaeobius sp. HRN-SO-5]|uniref:DUF7331 family protein n=1 Tax=Haloarchaeobius sp. HRN-SO-5 TaxID=3446118 RepID=UPI003EBF36EE
MNRANDTSKDDPPEIATRFRAREVDDETVEIYDEENDDAWIRSDRALELEQPN